MNTPTLIVTTDEHGTIKAADVLPATEASRYARNARNCNFKVWSMPVEQIIRNLQSEPVEDS